MSKLTDSLKDTSARSQQRTTAIAPSVQEVPILSNVDEEAQQTIADIQHLLREVQAMVDTEGL